jgi:hypothetical protein
MSDEITHRWVSCGPPARGTDVGTRSHDQLRRRYLAAKATGLLDNAQDGLDVYFRASKSGEADITRTVKTIGGSEVQLFTILAGTDTLTASVTVGQLSDGSSSVHEWELPETTAILTLAPWR